MWRNAAELEPHPTKTVQIRWLVTLASHMTLMLGMINDLFRCTVYQYERAQEPDCTTEQQVIQAID